MKGHVLCGCYEEERASRAFPDKEIQSYDSCNMKIKHVAGNTEISKFISSLVNIVSIDL